MSKCDIFLVFICVFVIQAGLVCAQFNTTRKLCYQFSWMGPKYNNESVVSNITCEDFTKGSNSIPCRHPLIITHDGTPPDMNYIWENHLEDATCLLTDDEICASFTYLFNGFIQNVTYMCTRVVDENQQAVTGSSCMSSIEGSRQVDLCICSSAPGQMPCNGISSLVVPTLFIPIIVALLAYNWDLNGLFCS